MQALNPLRITLGVRNPLEVAFQVAFPCLEVPSPASQEVHPFPAVHPSLEELPWEDAFLEACPLDLQAACPSEDPSVSCQVGLPCLGELPCPWEVVLHCQGACP